MSKVSSPIPHQRRVEEQKPPPGLVLLQSLKERDFVAAVVGDDADVALNH